MKKYIKYVIAVTVVLVSLLAISSYGIGIAGYFSKAFDKSLSPGELYERNITIRKYYNVTIRFQKHNSTSYLGFTDNESVVVLKDVNGNEVARIDGIRKGRAYLLMDRLQLNSIATASAYNISDYKDVIDQAVNISYSGAKAYITIKVEYGPAAIMGYVIDDLTGQVVEGVEVLAFDDGADPVIALAVVQNVSSSDGSYMLSLQLDSRKALDVYVKDYDVA